MANTKIYEIKAGANQNASVLFSQDKKRFYWNHSEFKKMTLGEYVFFVNKMGGYVFAAEINKNDISTVISNGSTSFTDKGENYSVSKEWPQFIRFNILEYKEVPADWNWKSLGNSESTYIGGDNVQTKENNVVRIEQLLELLTDDGSRDILLACKKQLSDQASIITGGTQMAASSQVEKIYKYITSKGFHFEPWQIAAYVTALKTKPFVILAGVSGTGKSKLPALVSEATGGKHKLIPVRPDWTDSAEVIGYTALNDAFRPGQLLQFIEETQRTENLDTHHVFIVDEMNLARVEHYFAEVLSRIEDRSKAADGGYKSEPLVTGELKEDKDKHWAEYGLPSNLAIVGTVNMDESTHGFSRKVLDRAFTIELSDINLDISPPNNSDIAPISWPSDKWWPKAIQLGALVDTSEMERGIIKKVKEILTELNTILSRAQLQVGYRTRDEIALFVIHAQEYIDSFITTSDKKVDPLDLALLMKILPRISGGSMPIRNVVLQLLAWAQGGVTFAQEEDARPLLEAWKNDGQLGTLAGARYPRTAGRLCLMMDRLLNEGFTSFWL